MTDQIDLAYIWERVSTPPAGLTIGNFIASHNSHDIHYAFAPSNSPESKGVVVMTHGYLEYGALYYDTIKRYQELDYNVFMMDFFGFGRSGRPYPDKPSIPSKKGISEHVPDLEDFIKSIVQKHSSYKQTLPMFMSTNSMGGQVALMYMRKHPDMLRGTILSSPLLHVNYINLPTFFRSVAQKVISLGNKLGLEDVPMAKSWEVLRQRNLKDTSVRYGERDRLIGEIHRSNADMDVSVPTWGWLEATFSSSAEVTHPDFLKAISTPLLWGTAGRDPFLDLKSHYEAVKYISSVEHVFLPNGIHALWRDNNETLKEWWGYVEGFLERSLNEGNIAENDNLQVLHYTKLGKA